MKVTEIYYLERVKTTDYAFKEIKMSAVLGDDNPEEATQILEMMVKRQLGLTAGKVVNVETKQTAPQANKQTNESHSEKVETPSNVGQTSSDNGGSENVAIEGAIAKAKELGGVAGLKASKDQLKKLATHLGLTFKSKDTNADLILAIDKNLGLVADIEVTMEVTEITRADVQNALRDVATHFKDGAKAVALIEMVAGVKTLADVPADKFAELVAKCKAVVA